MASLLLCALSWSASWRQPVAPRGRQAEPWGGATCSLRSRAVTLRVERNAVLGRRLEPRQLTNALSKARCGEDLLDLYAHHADDFNHVHVSAFWSRLGKLVRSNASERLWIGSSHGAFDQIRNHTEHTVALQPPRTLSNTAWGIAVSGFRQSRAWDSTWEAVSHASRKKCAEFVPQNLANVAWSFATAGYAAPQLFEAFSMETRRRLAALDAMRLRQASDYVLRDAALVESVYKQNVFSSQGYANIAWAFATAGERSPELFDAIAAEALRDLRAFHMQGLTNLAWAFATAGHESPVLLRAIGDEMASRIDESVPQGLAISSWTFATVGEQAPRLFDAIAAEAVSRGIERFKTQGVANLAWAFASAAHPAPELFAAIAADAPRRLKHFRGQGIANVAWAFAKAGVAAPILFEEIALELRSRQGELTSQGGRVVPPPPPPPTHLPPPPSPSPLLSLSRRSSPTHSGAFPRLVTRLPTCCGRLARLQRVTWASSTVRSSQTWRGHSPPQSSGRSSYGTTTGGWSTFLRR